MVVRICGASSKTDIIGFMLCSELSLYFLILDEFTLFSINNQPSLFNGPWDNFVRLPYRLQE